MGLRADMWQPSVLPQPEDAPKHDGKRSDFLNNKSTVTLYIEIKSLSARRQRKRAELEIKRFANEITS